MTPLEKRTEQLLTRIRAIESSIEEPPDLQAPFVYRCSVLPPIEWDIEAIEKLFDITLPPDLQALWKQSAGIRLFEEINYGQWGLIIWGPDAVVTQQHEGISGRREFLKGDLIIGEFRGDADLVVLRCDPEEVDFGQALISTPIDPREYWYPLKMTLSEFTAEFVSTGGQKFWETE